MNHAIILLASRQNRICGHRTSASISAFQAEEVGSIPIARSTIFKRSIARYYAFCLPFDPVFDPVFIFTAHKALCFGPKKKGRRPRIGTPTSLYFCAESIPDMGVAVGFPLGVRVCEGLCVVLGGTVGSGPGPSPDDADRDLFFEPRNGPCCLRSQFDKLLFLLEIFTIPFHKGADIHILLPTREGKFI